jgi:hypothetical protein
MSDTAPDPPPEGPCLWCGDAAVVVVVNGLPACVAHFDDAFAAAVVIVVMTRGDHL